jgi:ribosomal protein S18 acetylase RimI-like enzyme
MRVTTLSDNDYATVERIFKQVFDRSKWEQDFQEAWRKKDKGSSLGAYSEDGTLLAYAITTRKESYTFLEFFAVDPEIQGGGLGTTLLLRLLHENPKIQLVPVNNARLIHWYKKHGFEVIGEKKDKWGDPELLMSSF